MSGSNSVKPNHLEPSALGTKEYWDNLYTTEITNHSADPTDEGTIWFDDSSAEDKAVAFLEEQILKQKVLGEGNGHFLFRLREGEDEDSYSDDDEENGGDNGRGWQGRMLGVDYSLKSIEFARRIATEKSLGAEDGSLEAEFAHWDIMTESPSPILSPPNENGWDVVLDKGTFDAISLSEELDHQGRRICEGYKERVVPLLRGGGILLITSCNWTEEELNGWFNGGELEKVKNIEYKSFSFGGQKGQTISSVCFRK